MKKILPIILILFISCSVQSQLNRTFMGKDLKFIEKTLKVKASQVQEFENGLSKAVFIKDKKLGQTNISQGDATLDPMTSPPINKREYYTFFLDKEGKVIRTDYQKEYEKQ